MMVVGVGANRFPFVGSDDGGGGNVRYRRRLAHRAPAFALEGLHLKPLYFGGEGEIDSGHPGPRASRRRQSAPASKIAPGDFETRAILALALRAVAKALRRPKSLQAILSNSPFGGEGEIRTHEPRKGPPVFKSAHSLACGTLSHAIAIITDIIKTCPIL
jgi:hypothetical protein